MNANARNVVGTVLSLLAVSQLGALQLRAGYVCTVTTNGTAVSVTATDAATTVDTVTETFLGETVSTVLFDMSSQVVKYFPGGIPTYAGGTKIINGSQVRISDGAAFGYGPVEMSEVGSEKGATLVAEQTTCITNQLVLNNDACWMMSASPDVRLTVNRLATRGDTVAARFGRNNAASSLGLELAADEGNEPLKAIALRGQIDGVLSGTVKIASDAMNPFFRNTTPSYAQTFSVSAGGVTYDVAGGADTVLTRDVGIVTPSVVVTDVCQRVVPENASFESGVMGGWSAERIDSGSGTIDLDGVYANGSDYNASRPTTFGTYKVLLRSGHKLTSPEVVIPRKGLWRINFYQVGRDSYSNWDRTTEVTFKNLDTGVEVTKTLGAMESDSTKYVQTVTDGFELAAGRYKFSLYPQLKSNTTAMLYDNFVVEEVGVIHPANADFETGAESGWVSRNVNAKYNTLSGVYGKDNDYNTSRPTPSGTYKYLLRTGHSLTSPAFAIPEDGYWRLNFLRVGRASYSGSLAETDIVFTDQATGASVTNVLPGFADTATWQEAHSSPFALKTGSYVVTIFPHYVGEAATMLYDRFEIEKVSVEMVETVKKGEGRLTFSDTAIVNGLKVESGTLAVVGCDLAGASAAVSVATGSCFELAAGSTLGREAEVSVAPGGKLMISDLGDELIANGSFEQNKADGGLNFLVAADALSSWGINCITPNGNNSNGMSNGGVQGNGGNVSASGPTTPYGTYTAAVREYVKIQQTVTAPEAGAYRLSFVSATRKGYESSETGATVTINDSPVAEVNASSDAFAETSVAVSLEADKNVLAFCVDKGKSALPGPLMFFDGVSLRKIGTLPAVDGTIRLSPGSTLELNNAEVLRVNGELYVGETKINGGRAALRRAGVTVIGAGLIRAGEQPGMSIIIR